MFIKLNLGCGFDYKKSNNNEKWINLDSNKKVKADVYADLEKKLPFKDNTFDYVYAAHILEHIRDLIGLMKELKRICKNKAIIDIRVPHASGISAYQDPTHIRFFTYLTFDYFAEGNRYYNYDFPLFRIISKKLNYTCEPNFQFLNYIFNPIINLSPRFYERICCWILPCGEVKVKLKVIKS